MANLQNVGYNVQMIYRRFDHFALCHLSAFCICAVSKSLIEFHSCHVQCALNNHHYQGLPLQSPCIPQFAQYQLVCNSCGVANSRARTPVSLTSSDSVLNSQSCLLPYLSLCCCRTHYFSRTSALAVREPHVWKMKLVCFQHSQSRQCRAKGLSEKALALYSSPTVFVYLIFFRKCNW